MSITGIAVGVAAVGFGFAVGVITYRENTEQVEALVGEHIDNATDKAKDLLTNAKAKLAVFKESISTELHA